MSLYGNFTLKAWLALHCSTKDVGDFFYKALKDNDGPMAVLALAELVKRGDIELVADALRDAVDTRCITPESYFSTILVNTLTDFGDHVPILRAIAKTVRIEGWPKTSEELLDPKYLSGPEQIKKAAELLDGTDFAKINRPLDERIVDFLASFKDKGWISVGIGHFSPGLKWDSHTHTDNHCYLAIGNDGSVLNGWEIPDLLSILDAEGIADPLPAFDGKELDFYTLVDGKWASLDGSKEDFFYVSYHSVK